MPSSALHDHSNCLVTERLVRPERAFLHWTIEFLRKAFHKPVDLQVDPGVDERVEMTRGAENMMPDCGYTRLGGKELRCFKHFKTELGCSPRAIVLLKLDNQSIDKIQSSLKIEV
ncbi:hypothetical protein An01g11890 [Aspergillus niger]|uniref:Uncharacterized protein n=2 Tax=Aspergillus niger TaxID=5061 RepID=A2QAK9_ASPNC|nr:hypothetical protein An01g11890 [Aspergillus niger]CAK44090.1 hypothetical protein An01g11890 [Aspergillus niger]